MSYRGTALQYKIRKTTTNNKTGDNFSITIPRIIAQKFDLCFFKLEVSGTSLIFTSGCKISMQNTELNEIEKAFAGEDLKLRGI